MEKAFEICSLDIEKDGKSCYASIPQNAKYFYKLWMDCDLKCIGINQYSDKMWDIRLRGKQKNMQKFIYEFSINASKLYTLRETIW